MLRNNLALGTDYLRTLSIGKGFLGRFGELQNTQIRIIEFEQIEMLNGQIVKNSRLQFNGIKSYFPTNIDVRPSDIYKLNYSSISHSLGIDLWGTATLNYKHLEKIDPSMIKESQPQTNESKEQSQKIAAFFKQVGGFSDSEKMYKYYAIKRYLDDKILREKYRNELENIDTVYQGPGKQYRFIDLRAEFEAEGR